MNCLENNELNYVGSQSMKKVVFFANKFPLLSETFVFNQVRAMHQQGYDVEVISLFSLDQSDREIENEEFKIESRAIIQANNLGLKGKIFFILKNIRNFFSLKNKWFLLKESYKLFIEKNYSALITIWTLALGAKFRVQADFAIIHFANVGCYYYLLDKIGIINVSKSAVICHGNDMSDKSVEQRWLPLYLRAFDSVSNIWPISQYWSDKLKSWGVDSDKINVIRMGIDPKKITFSPTKLNDRNNIKVISVGRATEKKGLQYAIKAMASLDFVDYKIIGAGELFEELQKLVTDLNKQDTIHCLGALPHQEVLRLLEQADVFLLPSVTAENGDMEGIPVALMEAMAKGKIVVSTYHSGIPELIEDRVSGFLCNERSINDIINCFTIIRDISDSELETMLKNAKKRVVEDFNEDIEICKIKSKIS